MWTQVIPFLLGYDAVIPVEQAQKVGTEESSEIEILASVPPWEDVRTMGEDIVATELVVPANHRLRPQDLGAITGSGHANVRVYRQPRVAILPTGTELVTPGSDLKPGDIIEFNSIVLGSMAEEWGASVSRLPTIADDYNSIKEAVAAALDDHDMVVVNAGSSAGSEDYTASIFERPRRGDRPRHRHSSRPSRGVGTCAGQTCGRHPRLSRQRHDHF